MLSFYAGKYTLSGKKNSKFKSSKVQRKGTKARKVRRNEGWGIKNVDFIKNMFKKYPAIKPHFYLIPK